MSDLEWDAAWTAERHRRRQRQQMSSTQQRPPPPGKLARMPDGLDGEAAAEYRRRLRSVEAVVGSEEIAKRYPFAGAVAHLTAKRCPLYSLFAGGERGGGGNNNSGGGGIWFDAAERYVMHSIAHGGGAGGHSSGRGRTAGSADGGRRQRPSPYAGPPHADIDGAPYCAEAVVHAIALMLVHVCGPRTAAKFAMGHAQWTLANLRADMGGSGTTETARFAQDYTWLLMRYREAAPGAMQGSSGAFKIGLAEYVRRSVHIADPAWKLVNRRVEGGMVILKRDEMLRLARHDVCAAIERDAAATRVGRDAGRALEMQARNIATSVRFDDEAVRAATATAGEFGKPPCVTEAIASLGRAENLPHHGRLLVAAYMLRTGMSEDDVAALFVNAPDYSEATTRRQVAHIAGVGYMPQSCEKLESLGLCRRTPACGKIRNPVQFRLPEKAAAVAAKRTAAAAAAAAAPSSAAVAAAEPEK